MGKGSVGRVLLSAAGVGMVAATIALWHVCSALYGQCGRTVLLTIYVPLWSSCIFLLVRYCHRNSRTQAALVRGLALERDAGKQLCLAAIEALAYAVEGRTSRNLGHLARVQAYSIATAQALGIGGDELDGVRVAALVHEVGRLGVPDSILAKGGGLNEVEKEKVRAYPVLGARLLDTIPFPWPVVAAVRHHREHFDGSGYPDGLRGEQIPLAARILAVADTYDALRAGSAVRAPSTHAEAVARLERLAGTQFDPRVLAAFVARVQQVNGELEHLTPGAGPLSGAYEIARAQREVHALHELARSVGATLSLDEALPEVAAKIFSIVSSSTCVFYLLDEGDEWLEARAAFGMNPAYFQGSRARIGTYLTGRVASRGEPALASYMPDDIDLRPSAEMWYSLRSTLVVPMLSEGHVVGTINLYHAEPDAFSQDDVRVMLIVGELAGRAVDNARLFAQTQESAYTDAVTGLRNRRYMRLLLEQELNRARKNRHSLAVLGLDLDRFKAVNDLYGHERGDEVLREVGRALQAQVRNYDLVARYAGDEFAVLLPETTREQAEIVADKITRAVDDVADATEAADPNFPRVGVSVGIAMFPDNADDLGGLLEYADRVMYENKRARKAARTAA